MTHRKNTPAAPKPHLPQPILDSWIGTKDGELITSYGAPHHVYQSEDTKYLSYTYKESITIGDFSDGYGYVHTTNYECTITFTVNSENTVTSCNWQGNKTYCIQRSIYNPETVKWWRKVAKQGDVEAQKYLGRAYGKGEGVPQDRAEALKWWHKAAKQGDVEAQKYLGRAYSEGVGVPQDRAEAVKWYRKAAKQGDVEAQKYLGRAYGKGEGVPQDSAEALKWWHKAAEQGDAEAQKYFREALQDDAEAMKWYRKAAEQGDAEAQKYLGRAYNEGVGVPQDRAEAVKWYRKAAKQGDVEAQKYLGDAYYKGVPQNDAKAVQWYRKAAEQGDAEAQAYLGHMYHASEGVPRDLVLAYVWCNLAEAQGYRYSSAEWTWFCGTASVAGKMTPEEMREAQKMAAEWKPKKDGD